MTAAPDALEAALSEAVAKAAGLKDRVAKLHARKLAHETEARNARERVDTIRWEMNDANAERARNGASLDSSGEADAVEAERSAIAHEGAERLIGVEIAGLAMQEPAARLALTGAVLDFTNATRDRALPELLAAVSAMVRPLAEMVAAEDLRAALVGDRYVFDPAKHPPVTLWSARHLAFAIIDGLPARVTPDGLREEVIALADRIARETLNRLGVPE